MNKEYYTSKEWDSIRKKVLKRDNYTCQGCLQDGLNLDVHHLTYERFGDELACDLISLCRKCHGIMHGKDSIDYYLEKYKPNRYEYLEKIGKNSYFIGYKGEEFYLEFGQKIIDMGIDDFVAIQYTNSLQITPIAYKKLNKFWLYLDEDENFGVEIVSL
jgi:hypothetical protein